MGADRVHFHCANIREVRNEISRRHGIIACAPIWRDHLWRVIWFDENPPWIFPNPCNGNIPIDEGISPRHKAVSATIITCGQFLFAVMPLSSSRRNYASTQVFLSRLTVLPPPACCLRRFRIRRGKHRRRSASTSLRRLGFLPGPGPCFPWHEAEALSCPEPPAFVPLIASRICPSGHSLFHLRGSIVFITLY
jgi:hypothetical protein